MRLWTYLNRLFSLQKKLMPSCNMHRWNWALQQLPRKWRDKYFRVDVKWRGWFSVHEEIVHRDEILHNKNNAFLCSTDINPLGFSAPILLPHKKRIQEKLKLIPIWKDKLPDQRYLKGTFLGVFKISGISIVWMQQNSLHMLCNVSEREYTFISMKCSWNVTWLLEWLRNKK